MYGLLIAQVDHEPPVDHGVVLAVLVLMAVVGGLVYLVVKRRTARTRSDRGPQDAGDHGA